MSLLFLLSLLSLCTIIKSNRMYKQNNPKFANNPLEYEDISTVTSEIFQRLKHYEVVNIHHNQFHRIDDKYPIYPKSGIFSFHAFHHYYQIFFNKNNNLLHPDFHLASKSYNTNTGEYEEVKKYFKNTDCYFTAIVTSDPLPNKTRAIFSACKGNGIRGWIHAFNETIVIRPHLLLSNIDYEGVHSINHRYIVYRYKDLDRSDYPHTKGQTCGHGHPLTQSLIERDLEKYKKKPEIVQHIKHTLGYEHEHTHETDEIVDDIIANPLSEHAKELATNLRRNLLLDRHRRLATTTTTRYIELTVVVDSAFYDEYGSDAATQVAVVSIVSTLQGYYYDFSWDSDIGTVQIVLAKIQHVSNWTNEDCGSYDTCVPDLSSTGCSASTGTDSSCETSYSDYLAKFQKYRLSIDYYDNAQLFSYFNFAGSVIGYASLPGMCFSSSSGGIEQMTYDDEYNGNIVAHEMGHNLNMKHDSNGNTCEEDQYIMAAVGSPYSYRPELFSTCSDSYLQQYFSTYAATSSCLDNKPYETSYAVCGNGFVEQGESCDCGADDCGSDDPCCDGSKCALYIDADCSNSDLCCSDCQIKSSGTVCRTKSTTNSCDRDEEVCDGVSSECPSDTFYVEGVECTPIGTVSDDIVGYCYDASCISIEEQCSTYGDSVSEQLDMCTTGYSPLWQTDDCTDNLKCTLLSTCYFFSTQYYDEGTPCSSCGANACVCDSSSSCADASTLYTYVWTTYSWDDCSLECLSDENGDPGYQERVVYCTFQNGTQVNKTLCEADDEPISNRTCNDYVCDFCADLSTGLNQCEPNGECIDSGYCDCNPGWGGDLCDEQPSLEFFGIVSQTYENMSGITITQRIDPCSNLTDFYDSSSTTSTEFVNGATTLTDIYFGSTLGIRWNSTGKLLYLAVGMQRVDSDGNEYEDDWPFYVGGSLATDDQDCEDRNSSKYDPCFESLSCNDFTFTLPYTLTIPAYYKIDVRFNNYFNVQSNIINITCSENFCNSSGHGQCNSDGSGCECDTGWSGDKCSESVCADWTFSICKWDNVSNACSYTVTSITRDRCFDSSSTCNTSSTVDDEACTCGPHWDGNYCEIPKDYCSEFTIEGACNGITHCEYDTNIGECVYQTCNAQKNETLCADESVSFGSGTWTDYCFWNSSIGVCNRVTCDGDLPNCQNGAVRRPMYDSFSANPISICYGWYCDCSTVDNEDSYITVSTTSDLSVDSNFSWTQSLTLQYLGTNADLFICSDCTLECQHSSAVDNECTECSGCDTDTYQGTECDSLFWIPSFKIFIDGTDTFLERWTEFQTLMNEDLSYFLDIDSDHISIWQLKPSGSSAVLYFRYVLDTDDEDETQALGGDLMYYAQQEMEDENATAVRGFLMQFTDTSYEFTWCVPTREECDPDKQLDLVFVFYMCLASSFGFEILLVILYRIITRKSRRKRYEAKVHEVRSAQLELMNHHQKAQRVGMRDVSKKRAHHIHSKKEKRRKSEEKEIKRRATLEKDRQRIESKSGGHSGNQSEEEFERNRADSNASGMGSEPGAQLVTRPKAAVSVHSLATDPKSLPPGWKIFYNKDGIPYYFNSSTNETTWRHPAENIQQQQLW